MKEDQKNELLAAQQSVDEAWVAQRAAIERPSQVLADVLDSGVPAKEIASLMGWARQAVHINKKMKGRADVGITRDGES